MAMAAAAKLPNSFGPAAAPPVELTVAPDAVAVLPLLAVLVAVAMEVLRPSDDAASVPEAEVTMVVVQEQSEL